MKPPIFGHDWHVWCPIPGRAAQAAMRLRAQGYVVFRPMLVKSETAGAQELVDLFPGYAFVQFDSSRDPWGRVRGTIGVRRLLLDPAGQPETMPVNEMVNLLLSPIRWAPDARQTDLTGSRVRVTGGPLVDLGGVVTRSGLERVTLLLDMLSRKVTVTLPRASVEAAA